MKHHVFLSYAHKDAAFQEDVVAHLRASGLRVWYDEDIPRDSSDWQLDVETAIKDAGCVVVLQSPNARKSKYVRRERAYAEICDKRIFYLWISGEKQDAHTMDSAAANCIDLRGDQFNQGMKEVVESIRKLLGLDTDNVDVVLPTISEDEKERPKGEIVSLGDDEPHIAKESEFIPESIDALYKRLFSEDVDKSLEAIQRFPLAAQTELEAWKAALQKYYDSRREESGQTPPPRPRFIDILFGLLKDEKIEIFRAAVDTICQLGLISIVPNLIYCMGYSAMQFELFNGYSGVVQETLAKIEPYLERGREDMREQLLYLSNTATFSRYNIPQIAGLIRYIEDGEILETYAENLEIA